MTYNQQPPITNVRGVQEALVDSGVPVVEADIRTELDRNLAAARERDRVAHEARLRQPSAPTAASAPEQQSVAEAPAPPKTTAAALAPETNHPTDALGSQPTESLFAKLNSPKGRWGLGVLAVAISTTGAVALVGSSEKVPPDTCTSTTKIFVKGGESWGDLAREVTAATGYTVTDRRLSRANPGNAPSDEACLNLPAPLVGGQLEVSRPTTLKDVANMSGVSEKDLLKLNEQIADSATVPLPVGTIVWLTPKLDTKVSLQPLGGRTLQDITEGKGDELVEFVIDNAVELIAQGTLALTPDEDYYLPHTETEKLTARNVTTEAIIEANPEAYDPTKREKPPEPSPSPSASSPAAEIVINPETGLTADQEKIIAALDRTPEQKEFLSKALAAIMRIRHDMRGVNARVMLQQALSESGWGTSDKAPYFNFTGIKVPKDWKGPHVNLPTEEWDDAQQKMVPATADWCVFDGFDGWATGHRDIQIAKEWYQDALYQDDEETLRGLLNELGPNREIVRAGYLAYATDPDYMPNILNGIKENHIGELLPPEMFTKAQETAPQTRHITLDASEYSNSRDYTFARPGYPVRVGNQWVDVRDLSPKQRLKLMELSLNQVRVSAEGYQKFLTEIEDLRAKIAADPFFVNFNKKTHKDGSPYGKPSTLGEVDCLVNHYMAIEQKVLDDRTNTQLIRSMQNAGDGVAVQYMITMDGRLILLTDNYTQHAKESADGRVFNGRAFGVEVAATTQESVTPQQYATLVYTNVRFLVEGGFVQKGVPVTQVVNKRIVGHGEVNNRLDGGHTDFNTIVMRQAIKPWVVDLLVQMGYTA